MTELGRSTDDREQLERALLALRRMRARLDEVERERSEPIAIVGIGCRLPGDVHDPESFWALLRDGRDAITEIPSDRWDVESLFSADAGQRGKIPSRFGGFLTDVAGFDPHFFGISPREAMAMDPQQRLILEVAWEALEDAGQVPSQLAGSQTGVFVGIGLNDYGRLQVVDQTIRPDLIDTYTTSGNALCITANRLSYTLDLRGPSMAIDTACSSSLVAIHEAVRSLRSRESSLALAGGVNVILGPTTSVGVARFLAPDGRCKFGDARADGYVRAEGAAIVVLKPLASAQADGDRIYAVIRGTAVNQDGYSSGLTVPNGVAQQALIRQALADARIEPHRISYVEAHGTGTRLGDPIEAHALSAVLRADGTEADTCAIGSVKSNIGHLEAAAGVAGVIKVALSLSHAQIPPSLHYAEPNPEIPFDDLRLRVQDRLTSWSSADGTLIGGVSSFGFGGTNAHAILESCPPVPASGEASEPPRHLLTLSAKDPDALLSQVRQFVTHLASTSSVSLADICSSANSGRSSFAHRLAVVADSRDAMADRLSAYVTADHRAEKIPGVSHGTADGLTAPTVVFLFSGQGTQYVGMGRRLYETQPVFQAALDRCAQLLEPLLDQPLKTVLFDSSETVAQLDQTAYTQPALFAVEYALAELWRSWGIIPTAVLGHSVGEYVAACVAGVLRLEDAVRLVAARGRLMQSLPTGGAMAAVFATEAQVRDALTGYEAQLAIAALNEPGQVVISGASNALDEVLGGLLATGVKHRRLAVSHAFHSPLMDPMLEAFGEVARSIEYRVPQIPLVSNVTGQIWPAGVAPTAAYWQLHVREAVRFADGIRALRTAGHHVFLEVGPTPTLSVAAARCLGDGESDAFFISSLRRNQDDCQVMLEGLGALYVQGVSPGWRGVDAPAARRRVRVPTYPFQRQRYWFTPVARGTAPGVLTSALTGAHPLLGRRIESPAIAGAVFETQVSPSWPGYLGDHRLYGTPVVPATAYIEQALASAGEVFGTGRHDLENFVIQQALALPSETPTTVQVVLEPEAENGAWFQIFSTAAHDQPGRERWQLHASGRLRGALSSHDASSPAMGSPISLQACRAACSESVNLDDFYTVIERQGMAYGGTFRGLQELWRGERQAVGQVRISPEIVDASRYHIHPVLLDACIQTFVAALPDFVSEAERPIYVPIGIDRFTVITPPGGEVWAQVTLREDTDAGGDLIVGDLWVRDVAGRICAYAEGVRLKRATCEAIQRVVGRASADVRDQIDWLYEIVWRPAPALILRDTPRSRNSGRWLIFADRNGVGEHLAARLEVEGETAVIVRPGTTFQAGDVESVPWHVDPADPEYFRRLLRDAKRDGHAWRGIVMLWGMDLDRAPDIGGSPAAAQLAACGSALHIVQALAEHDPARLWFVTRGAQSVERDADRAFTQAPLWALARSILREQPEHRATCIDLSLATDGSSLDDLFREIWSDTDEHEVAIRSGQRFVPRLNPRPISPDVASASTLPVRIDVTSRGVLDNLVLTPMSRHAPGPGEVEIAIRASGLNFRDVLSVLDLYPGQVNELGNECAGTIVRVGADVNDLAIGDEVLAIAEGSHGSFVTADARLTIRKPAVLSFEEAATIPIAYMTAWYGLSFLAKLQPGDRVLIHAAAGGVGLAAVHLSQRIGAVVFATAGSPEKHAYLHSLGVKHIFSSRSTEFSGSIMDITDGEGVDVVLNSLSDELLARSFDCLRPGGRFVEIGRRGIWTSEEVTARRPDVAYFPFFLGEICQRDPMMIGGGLREIVDAVECGTLGPLPITSFGFPEAVEAFRHMAQARHIGKIVLRPEAAPATGKEPQVRRDGTYLITGGLGGLGLQMALWLADQGAGQVALVGRRIPSDAAADAIAELERRGIQVLVAQADVARRADIADVITRIDQSGLPLRGVIHAAGVIDDGVLLHQDWSRFASVLTPKIDGAWHLHTLTKDRALDFFLLFSAGAALLGPPGQGSYVAANAFLDGISGWRRDQGLPALSINWGPWAHVGMAATMSERDRLRLTEQGMLTIEPADGLRALEHAFTLHIPQVAILPMDQASLTTLANHGGVPTLLRDLVKSTRSELSAPVQVNLQQRVAETPQSQRRGIVMAFVRERVGQIMSFAPSLLVSPRQPLSELGLDSLMAVELRNSLCAGSGLTLSPTLLFDYPTMDALVGHLLADHLSHEPEHDVVGPTEQIVGARADAVRQLAQLSEQEAEQLLLAELGLPG